MLCGGLNIRAVKGLRGMVVVRRGRRWGREERVQGRIVRFVVGGVVVIVVGERGDGEEVKDALRLVGVDSGRSGGLWGVAEAGDGSVG